jgi:hypothetical protein
MKSREGFTMFVYTTPRFDEFDGADQFSLDTCTLVKNAGPLQGTKISRLCA